MSLRHHSQLGLILFVAVFLIGCGPEGIANPLDDDNGPTAIEVGNRAFDIELYETALNAYAIAQQSMPDRSEPNYNTANTLYRQERFREAIDLYDELLASRNLAQSSLTAFNSGNALYLAGEHEQAIEMYKETLRLNPADLDAKHNLELALAHLPPDPEEQQQQQQQDESEQEQQQQQQQGQQQQQANQQQEGEPQEGETEDEPQESNQQGDPSEPGQETDEPADPSQDPALQDIPPPERLTVEDAEQLLEAVGEMTEPLQNAIQRRRLGSESRLEREW